MDRVSRDGARCSAETARVLGGDGAGEVRPRRPGGGARRRRRGSSAEMVPVRCGRVVLAAVLGGHGLLRRGGARRWSARGARVSLPADAARDFGNGIWDMQGERGSKG